MKRPFGSYCHGLLFLRVNIRRKSDVNVQTSPGKYADQTSWYTALPPAKQEDGSSVLTRETEQEKPSPGFTGCLYTGKSGQRLYSSNPTPGFSLSAFSVVLVSCRMILWSEGFILTSDSIDSILLVFFPPASINTRKLRRSSHWEQISNKRV